MQIRSLNLPVLLSVLCAMLIVVVTAKCTGDKKSMSGRKYNGEYAGAYLNRIAFPIGGIGAGMFCLEGTGAFSHVSVRNTMRFFNEPCTFAALCVKGEDNVARVLEGPVPDWKIFGASGTGNGAAGSSFGLPRFSEASFSARFPFGAVKLKDKKIPLDVELTGWSPFIPGNADDACLPAGAVEYKFKNPTNSTIDAVFSYNTKNFMAIGREGNYSKSIKNGFVICQNGTEKNPEHEGHFAAFVSDDNAVVDHCWFLAAGGMHSLSPGKIFRKPGCLIIHRSKGAVREHPFMFRFP